MSKNIVKASQFSRHPFWFRSLNAILSLFSNSSGRSDISSGKLIARAQKKMRLEDFGENHWREPFEVLIRSINKEAGLHPIGKFIMEERLVNLLCNRLLAEYWFRKKPEILEQELYPVWLITGLQRTGTTKLQRLLDADPDNRVMKSWEALNPAPGLKYNGVDPRIKKARMSEKVLKIISPGYFAIHPVEHLEPEEDVLLLDLLFLSTTAEATMHVPSYAEYVEKTNQEFAYEYFVKILKLLQWQQPGKRWVLKSPHHLEFLEYANKSFHQPHVIWTHRKVEESLPSFLSMVAYSRALFSDEVSSDEVADHWKNKTIRMLQKGMEFRQKQTATPFTDILFDELVDDAIRQLEKIYAQAGTELKPGQLKKFKDIEKQNVREKYGRHEYQLKDFGLDKEMIQKEYGFYDDFVREFSKNR